VALVGERIESNGKVKFFTDLSNTHINYIEKNVTVVALDNIKINSNFLGTRTRKLYNRLFEGGG
jgi:hypothetical protein